MYIGLISDHIFSATFNNQGFSYKLFFSVESEADVSSSHTSSISDFLDNAQAKSEKDSPTVSSERHLDIVQDNTNSRLNNSIAQEFSLTFSSNLANETECQEKPETSIHSDNNEVQKEFSSPNKSDNESIIQTPSISNTSRSSVVHDFKSVSEEIPVHTDEEKSMVSTVSSCKSGNINVKKRVSEIMADAQQFSRGSDKSPRLQDFYTTTYDLMSPTVSPELGK